MTPLEERKGARLKFIHALYEEAEGTTGGLHSMWDIAKSVGLPVNLVESTVRYLHGKGLLRIETDGGLVSLELEGVDAVEDALSRPEEETDGFPAAVTIIDNSVTNNIHGNVTDSNIQQAGSKSTQTVGAETEDIQAFLTLLRKHLDDLGVGGDARKDLEVDIETVEAQLKRSSPSVKIVGESLGSIRRVMEGAVAGGLATKAPELFAMLASILGM